MTFTVTYTDYLALHADSIQAERVRVTPLRAFNQVASLVALARAAIYRLEAPGGVWGAADSGRYTITAAGQARDGAGNLRSPGPLGSFVVELRSTPHLPLVLGGAKAASGKGRSEARYPPAVWRPSSAPAMS